MVVGCGGGDCCCSTKHGKGNKILRPEQDLGNFSLNFQGPCPMPASPSGHFSVPFSRSPSCSYVDVHLGPGRE